MSTQDQHLMPARLPALYPSVPGVHLPARQPVLPLPGHQARPTSEIAPPGYHFLTSDAGLGVCGVGGRGGTEGLPDIVHSHSAGHLISPRPNQHRPAGSAARHHRSRQHQGRQRQSRGQSRRDPAGPSHQPQPRRGRTQSTTSTATGTAEGGRCKEPCVKCLLTLTSFRWVLVVLSLLGVLCVVTGIVLAPLHTSFNSLLFLAIMFIGLGVLLVIVVAVGWKCTPRGHEPLHALLSIGEFSTGGRRERRRPRIHRQRDGNWYGGMLYPEFQYPRPPPSYAASMQEYSSQLALVQSSNNNNIGNNNNNNSVVNTTAENYCLPGSPPPSYRSRASTIHSGVHITFPPGTDSMPPTYRSRASTHRRPRLSLDDAGANGGSDVADVSFSEPVITPEVVQQVIGTGRYQQRHGHGDSRGTSRHVRSASLDLAQAPDTTHHRRGASDHLTNILSLASHEQSPSSRTHPGAAQNAVKNQAEDVSEADHAHHLPTPPGGVVDTEDVEEVLRDLNDRILHDQGNDIDQYSTAL